MKRTIFLVLALLILISFSISQSVDLGSEDEETGVIIQLPELPTFNNATAFVNASQFWNTLSLGPLDDANDTQFNAIGQELTIDLAWLESFGNSLYVEITGDNMTGQLTIDNVAENIYALDLVGDDPGFITMRLSNVDTDLTNKFFGFSGRHYDNTEEDVALLVGVSTSTANSLFWGGGSGSYNTATSQAFYTASSPTATGFRSLLIDDSQVFADVELIGSQGVTIGDGGLGDTQTLTFDNFGTDATVTWDGSVLSFDSDLNISNHSITEIQCLNFSNEDNICIDGGDLIIEQQVNNSDIIFNINSSGIDKEFMRIDASLPSLIIDVGDADYRGTNGIIDVTGNLSIDNANPSAALFFHPNIASGGGSILPVNLIYLTPSVSILQGTVLAGTQARLGGNPLQTSGLQQMYGSYMVATGGSTTQSSVFDGHRSELANFNMIGAGAGGNTRTYTGFKNKIAGTGPFLNNGTVNLYGFYAENMNAITIFSDGIGDTWSFFSEEGKWTMDNDMADGVFQMGELQEFEMGVDANGNTILDPDATGSSTQEVWIGVTADDDMNLSTLTANTIQAKGDGDLTLSTTNGGDLYLDSADDIFVGNGDVFNFNGIDIEQLNYMEWTNGNTLTQESGNFVFFHDGSSGDRLKIQGQGLNVTDKDVFEISCLNFSNGDTMCGNNSIVVDINNSRRVIFGPEDSTFTGDVRNIDSINASSRFFETNLNNGTQASAVFTAQNNIGSYVTLGIGSSNLNIGIETLIAHQAGIYLNSTGPFSFTNGYLQDFFWMANIADDGNFPTSFASRVMHLTSDGALNVSKNITTRNVTVNEYVSLAHQTAPEGRTGYVQLYSKGTNQLFITRPDGTERRLLDGGGGSFMVDEVIRFNNVTMIDYLNGTFTGGSRHLCIFNNGTLFTSEGACP